MALATNVLSMGGCEVFTLRNIGVIDLTTLTQGVTILEAVVIYNGRIAEKRGTITIQLHENHYCVKCVLQDYIISLLTCTVVPRVSNDFKNERERFTLEENLMYTCKFEGAPLPRIIFYFNGQPISNDIDVSIVNNTLIIPSSQTSHCGIYQYIVSNEFGDDQTAWLLEIREPSEFV